MTAPTRTSSGIDRRGISRTRRAGRRGRSGQAMTEALIGLCLLSFTWLITAYLLTLAENRVRCAAIGRHAAWTQAHNPTGSINPAVQLTPFFIRHRGTVTPASERGVRTVDARSASDIAPGVLQVLQAMRVRDIPIQHVEQRLNINNRDDRPLYGVDQREVPLMREAFSGVGRVGIATCEWVTMTDVLDDRAAVQASLGL